MNKPEARNLKLKVAQGSMGALQKLRGNGDSKRELGKKRDRYEGQPSSEALAKERYIYIYRERERDR